MIKDMITVFIEHIEELEWMDKETKANAIKKVQLIPAPRTSKYDLLWVEFCYCQCRKNKE